MEYIYCFLYFCLGFLVKAMIEPKKEKVDTTQADLNAIALDSLSARVKILEQNKPSKVDNAQVMDTLVYLESQIKGCKDDHDSLKKYVSSLSPVHRHYYKYTPRTAAKEINQ